MVVMSQIGYSSYSNEMTGSWHHRLDGLGCQSDPGLLVRGGDWA
jgi:hypothetical protein